jgi:hypothetical protein
MTSALHAHLANTHLHVQVPPMAPALHVQPAVRVITRLAAWEMALWTMVFAFGALLEK